MRVARLALESNAADMILQDYRTNVEKLVNAGLALKSETHTDLDKQNYNDAKQELLRIQGGKKADEYTEFLQFIMTPSLNAQFLDTNLEMYAYSIGRDYDGENDENKAKIKAQYEKYKESLKNSDDYRTAFKIFKAFKEEAKDALRNFRDNMVETIGPDGRVVLNPDGTPQMHHENNFQNYLRKLKEVFKVKRFEISPEKEADILELVRNKETDDDILDKMNPDGMILSDDEKARLIKEYLLNKRAPKDKNPSEFTGR